ncbi:MAG TPA: hypothetical protein VHI51_01480 [Ktedonobacterales bacterium]|nr:hypothetical protein [Ktedonobacterales bacterium]
MLPDQSEPSSGGPLIDYLTESSDYYAGFTSVLRELADAQARGYQPTERQLALAVTHSARIYTTARGGKPVGGRSPDWLRGRVDGLRSLLRRTDVARPWAE